MMLQTHYLKFFWLLTFMEVLTFSVIRFIKTINYDQLTAFQLFQIRNENVSEKDEVIQNSRYVILKTCSCKILVG